VIAPQVTLDRMALDEMGYRPADLAHEIRRQLDAPDGYVDIEQIAYALDITEIKLTPLTSFEGAMLTDAERSCGTPPDLEHILKLAKRIELSKEATARRYKDLHDANTAMVFHQNGVLRYFNKSGGFPFLPIHKKAPLPNSVQRGLPAGTLTDMLEADPKDWFDGPPGGELFAQTLYQSDGVAITLLTLDRDVAIPDGQEEDGLPELGMPTFR